MDWRMKKWNRVGGFYRRGSRVSGTRLPAWSTRGSSREGSHVRCTNWKFTLLLTAICQSAVRKSCTTYTISPLADKLAVNLTVDCHLYEKRVRSTQLQSEVVYRVHDSSQLSWAGFTMSAQIIYQSHDFVEVVYRVHDFTTPFFTILSGLPYFW